MAKVQGNGLSISFATTSWTPAITSFSRTGNAADDVETSDLSTTVTKTYVGGALVEGGVYTFNFDVDPTVTTQPTLGVTESIVVTYPISVSGNSASTDTFPGYLNSLDKDTANNELLKGTFVLKVAGTVVTVDEA